MDNTGIYYADIVKFLTVHKAAFALSVSKELSITEYQSHQGWDCTWCFWSCSHVVSLPGSFPFSESLHTTVRPVSYPCCHALSIPVVWLAGTGQALKQIESSYCLCALHLLLWPRGSWGCVSRLREVDFSPLLFALGFTKLDMKNSFGSLFS